MRIPNWSFRATMAICILLSILFYGLLFITLYNLAPASVGDSLVGAPYDWYEEDQTDR